MISKLVSLIVGILIFLFSNLNADYHVGAIGGINFADLDAYVEGQSKKAEALPKPCGGLLFDIKTGLIDLKPEVEGIPDLIEFNENDNRYANQGLQLLMGITFTL